MQPSECVLAMNASDAHPRPGGSVSGPSQFALADAAFFILTMAHVGLKEGCVTTSCSIDFLRKPMAGGDHGRLMARAQLLKLGKRLSVGDVLIFNEHEREQPVARASLTYSIPPL